MIREAIVAALAGQKWHLPEEFGIQTEAELIDAFWRTGIDLLSPGAVVSPRSLDNETYHAGPGLSSTNLGQIEKSVAHYLESLKAESETRSHFVVGSAINDAILHPSEWVRRYVRLEGFIAGKLTPTVKKAIAEAYPEHIYLRQTALDKMGTVYYALEGDLVKEAPPGAGEWPVVLDDTLHDEVVAFRLALLQHETAAKIFRDDATAYEDSYYATDEETGLLVRCRPDIDLSTGYLGDLKTARDGSPDGFRRAVFSCRYYRQAAFYLDVCKWTAGEPRPGFFWLVVSKDRISPYGIALRYPDSHFLDRGRAEIRSILDGFAAWLDEAEKVGLADAWPGYPLGFERVSYYREEAA